MGTPLSWTERVSNIVLLYAYFHTIARLPGALFRWIGCATEIGEYRIQDVGIVVGPHTGIRAGVDEMPVRGQFQGLQVGLRLGHQRDFRLEVQRVAGNP